MSESLLLEPLASQCDGPPRRLILIVEDDESLADVLTIRLERQGYQTRVARSGSAGLELARQENPELVLMDLRLPDADGLDICQALDEDPTTCGIPVIALSGMERPDIIRRARRVGCRYYVRKPYDPNALLLLIEQSLRESGGI